MSRTTSNFLILEAATGVLLSNLKIDTFTPSIVTLTLMGVTLLFDFGVKVRNGNRGWDTCRFYLYTDDLKDYIKDYIAYEWAYVSTLEKCCTKVSDSDSKSRVWSYNSFWVSGSYRYFFLYYAYKDRWLLN